MNNGANNMMSSNGWTMKWYKFLIWFSLPFSVLLSILQGRVYLYGGSRLVQKDLVMEGYELYAICPELKNLDIVYGALVMCVAVCAAITWFKLLKRKKDGPMFLYILYAANGIISVGYSVAFTWVFEGSSIVGSTLMGTVIGTIFAIWANHKYFTNRKALFCN